MIRTKSAKFQIRNSQFKHRDFLWLAPPYPKQGDYEWALRISIDKWFVMTRHPRISDGGSGTCALCLVAGNLTNNDYRCGDCPVKVKTGKPNCEGTPLKYIFMAETWDEFEEIYKEIYSRSKDLYLDMYGVYYESEIFEED